MPTKFAKGDEVRVHAKKFDEDGETDALGLKWFDTFNVACDDFMEIVIQDLSLETGFLFFKIHMQLRILSRLNLILNIHLGWNYSTRLLVPL